MATSSSKAAGTVTFVVGDVRVTADDGTVRILQVGDRVFAKEVIATSANAVVQLHLENGSLFDLVRDSTITLDDDLLAGRGGAGPAATARQDVDELQAAIAANTNPARGAEATAAGPEAPGPAGEEKSGGEHAFVVVEQANTTAEVTSGLTTQSASIGPSILEPGISPGQQESAFLVQQGLPLPVRHESAVASVSTQMQAEVDAGHESRITNHEIVANSDKLVLNDLLQGEHSADDLTAYLSFTYDADTNTTTVNVKAASSAAADEKIVLTGLDLTAGGTLAADTIIQHLLTHARLHTDA